MVIIKVELHIAYQRGVPMVREREKVCLGEPEKERGRQHLKKMKTSHSFVYLFSGISISETVDHPPPLLATNAP